MQKNTNKSNKPTTQPGESRLIHTSLDDLAIPQPAPSVGATPAPSKEAIAFAHDFWDAAYKTMLISHAGDLCAFRELLERDCAPMVDAFTAPLREENERLTQFHVTLWNAIRRAKSVFDWLDVKNQHKECLPDIESVESALLLTPKESGGYVVMLESDRDALRDRLARLEAERIEWNKIYRPMYGHDWDSRNKGTKGF